MIDFKKIRKVYYATARHSLMQTKLDSVKIIGVDKNTGRVLTVANSYWGHTWKMSERRFKRYTSYEEIEIFVKYENLSKVEKENCYWYNPNQVISVSSFNISVTFGCKKL